jgi:hypothetical protein
MKSPLLLAAAASLLALAACNQSKTPEVLDANPDPMATELANKGPVEMPPAIKAEKTLRCKDNSLLYVTFFEGDKQAAVKTDKNGTGTMLKAPNAGEAMVAEGGWSLKGTTESVTVSVPGKGETTCHA